MARIRLREKLREKQAGRCCYCGSRMTPPRAKPLPTSETLEHLHRRDDGGGNHHDNMALACHRCNVWRGSMDWFTYASYRRGELWESV